MSTNILPLNLNIDLTVNVIDNDGDTVDISGATSVQVALGRTDYTETFVIYDAASGYGASDWANGVVVIPVLAADTDPIRAQKLAVEIDVDGTKYRGTHLIETSRNLI